MRQALSEDKTLSRREVATYGGGAFGVLVFMEKVLDWLGEKEAARQAERERESLRQQARHDKEALVEPWQRLIDQCQQRLNDCQTGN